MNTLLIEIGSEEIPAGYILPALDSFKKSILLSLNNFRIDYKNAYTFGTPRRLALIVENVADKQKENIATIIGPPEKIGYNEDGMPTIAAQKFALKNKISVDKIQIQEFNKGRYLVATIKEESKSSVSILEDILEKSVLSIPFPKRMRWANLDINFARPIISLTGFLGSKVLDFTVGNIKSSAYVFGHQFMNPKKYKIESSCQYEKVLESAGVIVDIDKRKKALIASIKACAKKYDASILKDDELVDIVTNLVEFPYPVVSQFDEDFLAVPDEVLITAMREHQKYFSLIDEKQNLKPFFIAVNNTKAKDMGLVAKGHAKVLRARLSDAKFFYEADIEFSLDDFVQKLKKVTYQEKLGTLYDKTHRLMNFCLSLADKIDYDDKKELKENVKRAAQLCKADLVSQVVIEFPKLQGIMGRIYAQKACEANDTALAIEQHYRPVCSGGKLPENLIASLLSIADKLDNICGCFSIDLMPSSSNDPYALRRQGIGIIQIMIKENFVFALKDIIDEALEPYIENKDRKKDSSLKIQTFLKDRIFNILIDQNYSKDIVNSVLNAGFQNVPDIILRVKALDILRKEEDFELICTTFKRVANIIKKAELDDLGTKHFEDNKIFINESLFESEYEEKLFLCVKKTEEKLKSLISKKDYRKALVCIGELRPQVDAFFDSVMVMTENKDIRCNRFGLLSMVSLLFEDIADFSVI